MNTKETNMKNIKTVAKRLTLAFLALIMLNCMVYADLKPTKDAAIDTAKKVAEKAAQVTQTSQEYSRAVMDGYNTRMQKLTEDRKKAENDIAKAKGNPQKQRELAITFYEKQNKLLMDMHDDAVYTSNKMTGFYDMIKKSVGGYSTAEGEISREATVFQNKEALLKEQSKLKNDADELLAIKKNLPKDKNDKIDKSTEEWDDFADREDELLEKYEDVSDEIRRSERKLKHYKNASAALDAHKGVAVKIKGRTRKLNRKYRSLVKDLATQIEIVEDMIAITDLGRQIAKMGEYENIAIEIDSIIEQISKMGMLEAELTIEDDDSKDGETGKSNLKGITLEDIVKGK